MAAVFNIHGPIAAPIIVGDVGVIGVIVVVVVVVAAAAAAAAAAASVAVIVSWAWLSWSPPLLSLSSSASFVGQQALLARQQGASGCVA